MEGLVIGIAITLMFYASIGVMVMFIRLIVMIMNVIIKCRKERV